MATKSVGPGRVTATILQFPKRPQRLHKMREPAPRPGVSEAQLRELAFEVARRLDIPRPKLWRCA